MSNMYPDDKDITIHGQKVTWPGMGADGKFTNGSFDDPNIPPSFIPAESMNLVLDNLGELIKVLGGIPNNTSTTQLAKLLNISTVFSQIDKLASLFCFRKEVDRKNINKITTSGLYTVKGSGYKSGLIVFNFDGSSLGVVQIYKDGYKNTSPWKIRNAIDGNIHNWTSWLSFVTTESRSSSYSRSNIRKSDNNIDTLRHQAYSQEADPLFFKYQRGEIEKQEWLDKISEIKERYPKVAEN